MERGLQALAKAGIKEPEEGLPRCYGVVNHAAGVEGKATVKPSASTGYRSVYGVRQEIASMILTEIDAAVREHSLSS